MRPRIIMRGACSHASINKITRYYGSFAPEILDTRYAEEIWSLYESGELYSEVVLSGEYHGVEMEADVDAVLEEIKQAFLEEQQRLARLQEAS